MKSDAGPSRVQIERFDASPGWVHALPRRPVGQISVPSQRESVVNVLLAAIDEGRLGAGDLIAASTVAAELGVAPATVRDAWNTLRALRLLDEQANRTPSIVTPSRNWLRTLMAECSGLSVLAAEEGIGRGDSRDRVRFTRLADRAHVICADHDTSPVAVATTVWTLLQILAGYSRNKPLMLLHARKRHALRFGFRHFDSVLDRTVLAEAVDALGSAVHDGDRVEGAEIIRDMYTFTIVKLRET